MTNGAAPAVSSGPPHSPQKRSSGSFAAPHAAQVRASGFPHVAQNFRPARLSAPQLAHSTA